MTTTTQAPGRAVDTDAPRLLPLDAVIAHGDAVTRSVASALSVLAADVQLDLGPSEVQDGPSDLAPEQGTHGVMVTLGGGSIVQVAVILDDALQSRVDSLQPPVDGAAPGDVDPAAPPAWLGAVSNAVDGWARSEGSVVSGALPVERSAELEHLLALHDGLVLVAAGLFHDGRHAGTVAVVARSAPAAAAALIGDPAGAPMGAVGSATTLTAPLADGRERSSSAELPRSADLPGAAALRALADVEMLVTAELGRTRMNVADLLELGPGAVIELDRTAGSPIDLLVNGTLIARGEVVVIDEEYGIRLTEIVGSGEV